MTLPIYDRRIEYVGNGVATVFNGPNLFEKEHLFAYLVTDGGAAEEVPTAEYEVTNLARNNGTRVTMNTAPASNQILILLRTVPAVQTTDITNQGAFLPETLEKGIDYLGMLAQQHEDGINRSLRYADNVVGAPSPILPDAVTGAPLVFAADGSLATGDLSIVGDMLLRPELAAPGETKGSALVAYTPAGDGTVPRSVRDKLREFVSVQDFGAKGDGVTDDTPAFRACIASGRKVIVPKGDYVFDSTLGAIAGVASAPCVVLDGISDFELIGQKGARILMGPTQALTNNNFFTVYVSAAQEALGNYSQRIRISNIELVYARDASVVGNVSGINLTSSEDCEIDRITFNASTATTPSLGLVGTGGKGNHYHHNTFKAVSTCHDQSQMENCTWEKNKLLSGAGAVTGFNHFYDSVTIGNVRLETPISQVIASGNRYVDNDVVGYGSAFSIRGMRDSWIQDNRIHGFAANDAVTRNMISIFTDAAEFGLAPPQHVRGITVERNIIYDVVNAGAGTTRGIFINQFAGARPVTNIRIVNNVIHDMAGEVGISFDGTADDWEIFGNSIDAATVGTPYGRDAIVSLPGATSGASPTLTVTGAVDLILKPGAARFVRFGTRTANADAPITGYIEIRDEAGTNRKLALIA